MVRRLRVQMTDEYIRRIYNMIERSDYVSEEIVKMDIDLSLCCRHRKEEYILERLAHLGRLLGGLPLLEKSREGHAVQRITCLYVSHADLTIAANRHLCQISPSASPSVISREFIQ